MLTDYNIIPIFLFSQTSETSHHLCLHRAGMVYNPDKYVIILLALPFSGSCFLSQHTPFLFLFINAQRES